MLWSLHDDVAVSTFSEDSLLRGKHSTVILFSWMLYKHFNVSIFSLRFLNVWLMALLMIVFVFICLWCQSKSRLHITLPKSLSYLRTALNGLRFWVVGGWILSIQAGSSAWNSSLILQTKYSLTTQYSIRSSLCIFYTAICFLTS